MEQRFGALTPQPPDRAATPPPVTHGPWRALWEHGLAALLDEAEGQAARALHRANVSVIDTLLLPLTPVEGDAEDLLAPGAELRALAEQLEAIVAVAHASPHPAATAHVRAARQAIDAALQGVPLPAHWAGSLLLLMQLLIARLSRFQAHDLTDAGVLDTLLLVAQHALHLTARPDACPGAGCACRLSGEAVAWLADDWMVIFGSTEGVGCRVHDAVDHRALSAKELLSIERICGPQILLDYVHASNVVLPSTTLLRLLHQCGTPRPPPDRHWPVEALTISMGTVTALTAERDRARADEIHRLWVVALAQQLALHGDTPDYHAGASWAAVWAVDQRLSTLALHQPAPAPDRAFIAAGLALKHVLRATAATTLSLPERMRHRVAAVTWSLRDVHLSDPDVVVKLVRHVAERHRAGSTGEAEERLLRHLLERACTPEHVVRGLCAVLDCPQWFGGLEVTAGHTARRDVARRIRLHVSALGFTAAQLATLFSHARDALLARGGGGGAGGSAGVEARLLVGFIRDLLTDLGPMLPGRTFAPAPLELLGELPHVETSVLETAARHMAPRGGYEASLSMNVTPGYLTLLHQLFSARSVEDVRAIATTAATTAHTLAEGPQEWMQPRARQLMRALMIHAWYFATGRTATETGLNPRTLRTSLIMGGTDATELTLYLGARCTDPTLQEEARSSIHRLTPSKPRHAACLTLATLSAVASNNLPLLQLMMEVHAGHTILVVLHGLSAWLAPGWGCAHDDTLDWPEGDAARATAAEEEERLCETAILLGDAVKDALKTQGQLMIAGARSVMETLLQQPHHKAFALCSLRCLSRLTSASPAALIAELRVALDAPTRAAVVAQLETHAQQMSYVSVGVEGEDEMEVAAINDPTINIVGYQPPHSYTPPDDEGAPMDTGTTAVPMPPLSDAMETTSTHSLTPPVRRANASSHSRGHAPLAAPSSAPFVQNFSAFFSARSGFISPSPSISGLFGHTPMAAHAVPHTPIDSPARSHGAYTPTAAAVAATTALPPLQIWSLEGEGEPATHEHDSLLGGLPSGGFGEPADDFMS